MKLFKILSEIAAGFFQARFSQWWAEITTADPRCTYYFGPFGSALEARKAYPGYVEDLQNENAQGIAVTIKLCQPEVLTICDREIEG
ncbi:MAG: DUF1816 domain-containing protein [Leptolyngbyaceae cyanobacterium CSU_1_3]|nr:DUF1816 domain-containing protein [Leptolyngbyaceae cyanobacterium CSU_1_3]